jgi:hypothetical protein
MRIPSVLFVLVSVLLSVVFSNSSFIEKIEVEAKGVSVKEDLSSIVFNSVRLNDFQMLLDFIPDESQLDYLKSNTSKKNEYIYVDLNREELEKNTKVNFENLEEEGIKSGVNWSTVRLVDNMVLEGKRSDKRIYKGILMLQDANDRELKISFDIIKIDNAWFLFQGMRIDK